MRTNCNDGGCAVGNRWRRAMPSGRRYLKSVILPALWRSGPAWVQIGLNQLNFHRR